MSSFIEKKCNDCISDQNTKWMNEAFQNQIVYKVMSDLGKITLGYQASSDPLDEY